MLGIGLEAIAKQYPRLFMGMVHHRTTTGEHLTFRDKPWLTDIYKDNSHNMVVIKCSQVHMTEHALCAMFTFAQKGKRGMYVLPSKEHRKTFVSDRVNRMKDYSSLYADAIKTDVNETDSNVYKTIFGTGWKFVGSNVRKDFFEFPCDVLFFDEYDELDQANLWYAYDRVSNAKHPVIWKFGNPTRDNCGIHAAFLASDQKEWHVSCEHCGHEQILDWYEHFVIQDTTGKWKLRNQYGRPICTQCGHDFDRAGAGRWIALNPGRNALDPKPSGYRVSRLFVVKGKRQDDILTLYTMFLEAQSNPTALQNFHNNYLAVTYENADFRVTQEALQRSVYQYDDVKYDPATFRTVMGVDQGRMFTCTISLVWNNELIDVYYGNVKRWADVEELEEQYNVAYTVIDANGGGYAETRDFVNATGARAGRYMCYYRPKDQIKGELEYKLDPHTHVVETNRTECIDLMVKMLLDKKAHVRSDYAHAANGEFALQMLVPARITDSGGAPVWTKGKDHFFHACVYRYLAWRVSGMNNSVHVHTGWHTGAAAQREVMEPKAHNIGEVTPPPIKRKRKSWSV
jgi:hypothetical protein